MVKICFTKSESQKKKNKKTKKFDENQATMGNYISKPNTLTNKKNLLMRKTRYLVGPVEPYNSASLMIKFVFVFLPHTNLPTFPILTLMKITA